MKITIIILTLLTHFCFGQEVKIDSCGIDDSPTLNEYEVQYFNEALEDQRKRSDFNFQNKKIGFAYGNFGKELISKKQYFDQWGRENYNNGHGVVDLLLVLTAEEKLKSGGYDAVIVSWSKIGVYRKHRDRLIKNLKEKDGS